MQSYNNFIGIDIGKLNFVVAVHGKKETNEYENNSLGINQFIKEFQKELPNALCVIETTGGYEMRLLLTLCNEGISVHRANTRKVKNFIRSFGIKAKTDALDAKALALYGRERADLIGLFQPQSKAALDLYELVQRRQDIKKMLVSEKNRLSAPRVALVKQNIRASIEFFTEKMKEITAEINELINNDAALKEKKKILKTIPGIGDIIANELLVLLPELGHVNRREVASLIGVAPIANDSGMMRGYRRTGHGRQGIKPILFLAAMSARNSHSHLKTYYENLIAKGKKKMVALVALMRKIIVIANAKLKYHSI